MKVRMDRTSVKVKVIIFTLQNTYMKVKVFMCKYIPVKVKVFTLQEPTCES